MKRAALIALLALCLLLAGCGVWGQDATVEHPELHPLPQQGQTPSSGTDQPNDANPNAELCTFVLELRMPSSRTEVAPGDTFAHSATDGELIASWQVPVFGNTLYESLVRFSEQGADKFSFRLSQHRFYMLHDCTLADGSYFNLETCYIAVDGQYAMTANHQSLAGADGTFGTADDVRVVTVVYRGWLYGGV